MYDVFNCMDTQKPKIFNCYFTVNYKIKLRSLTLKILANDMIAI